MLIQHPLYCSGRIFFVISCCMFVLYFVIMCREATWFMHNFANQFLNWFGGVVSCILDAYLAGPDVAGSSMGNTGF